MNNPKLRFRDDSGSRFVDWQKVSFGKTFSFLKSSAFSRAQLNYRGGQIKNVHYGDILVKFPTILNSCCNDVPYVNPAEKTEKYDLLQVGDIVIADTAEDLTVGKAIEISDVSNNIIAGLHTIACRPQRKFANRFLGYYLNSKAFHNQLVPLATGIKVYSIIKSEIVKTRINVPCLEEQQKIANFFSTLDEKIELSERKLEALQQLKKGLMQKIFSNSIWGKVALKTVCQSFSGGTPSSKNKDFYVGDIPFIRSAEIHGNTTALFINQSALDKSSAKMVNKGDLLYALYGANSGDCDISKINGAINQAILCIRPLYENTVDVLFLKEQLYHWKGQIISTYLQGGQGNLSGSLVMNLSVMLPPYKEQVKISALFSLLNDKIDLNKQKISLLQQLKQGFMQQMFV